MSDATLVIRNGTVVDGTGGDPFEADVAIAGDRIARGRPRRCPGHGRNRRAREAGDAGLRRSAHALRRAGDVGQSHQPVLLARRDHGADRQLRRRLRALPARATGMLIKLMEGVEDIPEVVLTEGLPWNWQTFPQFLDALDARRYDLDVATQVPHAALRVYVMGERGADREDADRGGPQRMAQLAAEGIGAGALGFSTSRTLNHKTLDGRSIPTLTAAEDELATSPAHRRSRQRLAAGDRRFRRPTGDRVRHVAPAVGESRRPVSITVLQRDSSRSNGAICSTASRRRTRTGCRCRPGAQPRRPASCSASRLRRTRSSPARAFLRSRICHSPKGRRVARSGASGKADRRAQHRRRSPSASPPGSASSSWRSAELRADSRAERRGAGAAHGRGTGGTRLRPADAGRRQDILYRPLSNYAHGNLDTVREMMTHPNTLLGPRRRRRACRHDVRRERADLRC